MGLFVNKDGDIKFGSIIGTSVLGILAAVTLISACEEVPTGCTGVQVVMGSVQTETLDAGFHFKTPFVCDVVEVDNKIQKVEVDASSVSKDLQDIASTLAINYHLAPEASVQMYKTVGLSYEDSILQPAIQESTKSIMAQYRNEQRVAAAEADAAEAKARAEGEAEAAKIKAQGEAEAIKARAEAEAEANRKISESITPELIDYNRIESWDGKLPSVMTGGNGGNVIVDATK